MVIRASNNDTVDKKNRINWSAIFQEKEKLRLLIIFFTIDRQRKSSSFSHHACAAFLFTLFCCILFLWRTLTYKQVL